MLRKVLFAILLMILSWIAFSIFLFFRPLVTESTGSLSRAEAPVDVTLSESYPASATDIHFARASVSMGGRFLAYRFSASIPDLHAHAKTEFDSHWDALTPTTEEMDSSPFDQTNVDFWKRAYGVKLEWLRPKEIGRGVMYMDEDGVHRPIVYIDEDNSTLYFVMTD